MLASVSGSGVDKDATLMHLSAADWPRLGELFSQVFGHPLESELAEHKYAHGHGESMALVSSDGEIVAHCGMTFRRLLAFGEPIQGVQLGDLMVKKGARGPLSRNGSPFYRIVSGALQHLNAARVKPLVFGFPSDRAMRVGERLGVFTELDQVIELIWKSSEGSLEAKVQLTADRKFFQAVDEIWEKMAKDLVGAVAGVRDSAYFEHRYFLHPVNQYRIYLMSSRWMKLPLAVFVLRSHGETVELVDWVAPLELCCDVIEQARRAARLMGGLRLMAWMARGYADRFSAQAVSVASTEFRIPVCGFDTAHWVSQFKGHLWVTSGDTDYR